MTHINDVMSSGSVDTSCDAGHSCVIHSECWSITTAPEMPGTRQGERERGGGGEDGEMEADLHWKQDHICKHVYACNLHSEWGIEDIVMEGMMEEE